MGFGKKMDYANSKEIDLDKIYNFVIKPVVKAHCTNYKLIRADEISGSTPIDASMYALLLEADLVIADITTLNPNAIYELGVRHAVKPYSTIIMAQKCCDIPFDINHCRCLRYEDYDEEFDSIDVAKTKNELKKYIDASESEETDSPFYRYVEGIEPPSVKCDTINKLVEDAENKTEDITKLMESAMNKMSKDEFVEAILDWEELKELLPNNDYVIQQLTLATYKSKLPNETLALDKALALIKSLNPSNSLDLETIGITGAIYKRLYKLNKNYDYLDEAIKYYQKGYIVQGDYYNGENFANCTLLKTLKPGITDEEKISLQYISQSTYKSVVDIINAKGKKDTNVWMFATLAVCCYALKDMSNYNKYDELFHKGCDDNWKIETYKQTIMDIDGALKNLSN